MDDFVFTSTVRGMEVNGPEDTFCTCINKIFVDINQSNEDTGMYDL